VHTALPTPRRLPRPVRLPITGRRLQRAFAALGPPQGRGFEEVVTRTTTPDSVLPLADGSRVCHWQSAPGWGRVYAITLLFDARGTCVGISSEYAG
jgi:hypothetical protein